MTRIVCLTLLGFAACFNDPGLEPVELADLPAPLITFGRIANGQLADSMFVEIKYGENELGKCALLSDSFRATIGGAEMTVTHRGSISGSESLECRYPTLRLDVPPTAESIVLEDDSKKIVINTGPWLVRLHPEPPWIAEVGRTVKVPYAPATALPYDKASLVIRNPEGEQVVPFGVSGGELTFTVPDRVGAGSLKLVIPGGGTPKTWPCTGATCRVVGAWEAEVPIEIRPAM